MQYIKDLPRRYDVDVFIAGGGPSGVAAAVTCARQGRQVFLAESRGAFGGLGTVGMVPEIMPFTDGTHFLAGGFGRDVFDALYPGCNLERRAHTVRAEELKRVYDRMMVSAGVRFQFFTTLIDVITDGAGRVLEAVLSGKSGMFTVRAKVFIDCTGDGDLCAMAGAEFEMGDASGTCMAATLCSLWSGVDFSRVQGPDHRNLEQAIADGVFTQPDRHLPGMRPVNAEAGIAGGNIGHCFQLDATDERSLTMAMLRGRQLQLEFEHYYKEYLTGYESMTLAATADMMGVRESRRITGDYVLCTADFLRRAVFEDEIGRYNYPVDMHVSNTGKAEYERFEREIRSLSLADGESYGIPYRCLIPRKLSNVLVAGRCVSTDRPVQASLRVIPGCYITGQAAGMAASLTEGPVRDVDVAQLQAKLREYGAYLPNE